MTTKTEIKAKLAKKTGRSAWEKGVIKYAKDMADDLEGNVDYTKANITKHLLNGASSWKQASYGGCGLIYNEDIAKRLCTPSELKRSRTDVSIRTRGRTGWTSRPGP